MRRNDRFLCAASSSVGGGGGGGTERTEEEKAAIEAAREARKAEKEAAKAAKKAKKEAEAALKRAEEEAQVLPEVTYLSYEDQASYPTVGDLSIVMSRSRSGRTFVKDPSSSPSTDTVENDDDIWRGGGLVEGETAWVRGRVHSVRAKGGSCFLVLRIADDHGDGGGKVHTIQACYFKDKSDPERSRTMLRYLGSLTVESIVDVEGVASRAEVKACTVTDLELQIVRVHRVSAVVPSAAMPFTVMDASRSDAEVDASQDTDRPHPRLGQELRLDHRWLDLRVPAHRSIVRMKAGVCRLFRRSLDSRGFLEIHTPKLLTGESETGAGVFTTDYFGTTACLAQSPQLYKQMAVAASDLNRVYEAGPVFWAENSNTR